MTVWKVQLKHLFDINEHVIALKQKYRFTTGKQQLTSPSYIFFGTNKIQSLSEDDSLLGMERYRWNEEQLATDNSLIECARNVEYRLNQLQHLLLDIADRIYAQDKLAINELKGQLKQSETQLKQKDDQI